jgi:hypothetical protein
MTSPSSDGSNPLSFEAMGLKVGQNLQLVRHAPSIHKCYTSLIGYVDHEFMIVRLPREEGGAIRFEQGQMLEIRLFSGVSIFSFESCIETMLMHPRNYMLMTYPGNIREHRLRSHQRVAVDMPIDIKGVDGTTPAASGFRIIDLSGGGALISGPVLLGQVGARWMLTFHFDLNTTGKMEHLTIGATLQNIQPPVAADSAPVAYLHGVKFDAVDPRIALLVHEVQNKTQTSP